MDSTVLWYVRDSSERMRGFRQEGENMFAPGGNMNNTETVASFRRCRAGEFLGKVGAE